MGCLIHGIMCFLHLVAILLGVIGLIITIPLHIIVYILLKQAKK